MPFNQKVSVTGAVAIPDAAPAGGGNQGQDGVMTAAQAGQLNAATKTATQQIYVSPSGNDASPGTQAAPLRTLDRAISLLPATWRQDLQIILAPGTYTYSSDQLIAGIGADAGPSKRVTPLVLIGSFTDEVGTRTSTSVTNSGGPGLGISIADATLAVTPNAYEGYSISIVSGANAGQRRMIRENTATQFDVNAPFDFPLTAGDQFVIEKPAVNIDCPNGIIFGQNGGDIGLKGIRLFNSTGSLFVAAVDFRRVQGEGCEFTMGGFGVVLIDNQSALLGRSFPPPWNVADPLNPFSFARHPAGIFLNGQTGGPPGILVVSEQAQMSEFFVLRNVLMFADSDATVGLSSVDAKDTAFNIGTSGGGTGGANLFHTAPPFYPGRIGGAGSGIVIDFDSEAFIDALDISGVLGNAVNVLNRSYCALGAVTGANPGSAVGILVDGMSQAHINAPPGSGNATSVTGTNDAQLGHTTVPATFSYATINTPDGAGVKGVSDVYLDRIEAY